MKSLASIIQTFLMIICLTACSIAGSDATVVGTETAEESTKEETTKEETTKEETTKKGVIKKDTDVSEEQHDPGDKNNSSRSLSQEELDQFTAWAQKGSNIGLLLSDYSDPSGVDLNEVFYNGAGLPSMELTDDELQTYLEITGQSELENWPTVLTSSDINDYLERKLGISFDSVRSDFDWIYLSQTDVWVTEHGDTNLRLFRCVDGNVTDENKYVLMFETIDDFSDYQYTCETTLMKNGEDYRVLSNHIVENSKYKTSVEIAEATDDMLAQYASYDEFDASIDNYGIRLLLTTDNKLSNLRLFRLTYDESIQNIVEATDGELYRQNELTPEKPLVLWVSFPGTIPPVGIEFIDADGTIRNYYIYMSGMDGSIQLEKATFTTE